MTDAAQRRPLVRAICLLGVSVLALSAAVIGRQLKPPSAMIAGAPLEALRSEADALRPYDDGSVATAEARRVELMGGLWTPERFTEWKRALPPKWIVQEGKAQTNRYTVMRRVVLNRPDANARDWPEIYDILQQLDALPSAVVAGLTLTMPQPQTRQFQTVQVVLTLAFRKDPPEGEPKKE